MTPLNVNVKLIEHLLSGMHDQQQIKIVKSIQVSNQLVLSHQSDLINKKWIETGNFKPSYSLGNVE